MKVKFIGGSVHGKYIDVPSCWAEYRYEFPESYFVVEGDYSNVPLEITPKPRVEQYLWRPLGNYSRPGVYVLSGMSIDEALKHV